MKTIPIQKTQGHVNIELLEAEEDMRQSGLSGRELGRLGEQYVSLWLQNQGWKIAGRNWQCRYGEIDLIFLDPSNILVFVEVKTRRSKTFGTAADAVHYGKQRRLKRAATQWLLSHDSDPQTRHKGIRFDVIALTIGAGPENQDALSASVNTPVRYRTIAVQDTSLPTEESDTIHGWNQRSIFLRHIREAF